jgi:hypothetical protein
VDEDMRSIVLLLASVATALVLTSGIALAQEGPLPDLVVTKTGPEEVALEKTGPSKFTKFNKSAEPRHEATVVNVGDAPAVFEYGEVLINDDLVLNGRITSVGNTHFGDYEGIASGGSSYFEQDGPERRPFWTAVKTNAFLRSAFQGAVVTVQPGQTFGTITWATFVGEGTFENCATADPDNVIVESDETNNTACFTTVVRH